jgi:hypothetical protein
MALLFWKNKPSALDHFKFHLEKIKYISVLFTHIKNIQIHSLQQTKPLKRT